MAINDGDLQAAVPDQTGPHRLAGLTAPVEIVRDPEGVAHIRAASISDAFFAQGFVHAQDRLWQLEYDRQRAAGRWAEWAGRAWLDQDILYRRLDLPATSRRDYAAFDAETRAVFDAFAAGVNAFIASTPVLPIEYQLVGASPAPWQPWDSCTVYKVRHALMGTLGGKLWRAQLLQRLGPELLQLLRAGETDPGPLIAWPGADYAPPALPAELLAESVALLEHWDWEGGSNSWALDGSRTASGKPLLAGDPHRALEVPNVYYPNHLACPDFDVIGLSFAGVPGFPHFGHNAEVAWCVTHAMADYQDLFIERFAPGDPSRYEYQGAWHPAERRREVIQIRGAAPVEIDVTVTQHGPIILGDPAQGQALALRYTATDEPNAGFTALLPMLRAGSVAELDETMRRWVDPANNFLMADRQGTIGYLTRGRVPQRAGANAWLPVPGWTGDHEWHDNVPFDAMPRVRNPATGFIVTANNRIIPADYPYHIAIDWAAPHRSRRITSRVASLTAATVADMTAIHAERQSLPGRLFIDRLATIDSSDARLLEAKRRLLDWDGAMQPAAVGATLYAVWREQTIALLLEGPALRPLTEINPAREPVPLRGLSLASRLRGPITALLAADDPTLLPPGQSWSSLLTAALVRTIDWLTGRFGPDMSQWQWGRLHVTAPVHPLAGAWPELAAQLNPPSVGAGGDGDTPQAASFAGLTGTGFALTATSVARYCFDLADWEQSGWVIPLGASGHPGSPHFANQVEAWRQVRLFPMRYDWGRITREASHQQRLEPA